MPYLFLSRILELGLWDSRNERGTEKVNKAVSLSRDCSRMDVYLRLRVSEE